MYFEKKLKSPMIYKIYNTDLMCTRAISPERVNLPRETKFLREREREREVSLTGLLHIIPELQKGGSKIKNALLVGQMCFQLVRKNSKIT